MEESERQRLREQTSYICTAVCKKNVDFELAQWYCEGTRDVDLQRTLEPMCEALSTVYASCHSARALGLRIFNISGANVHVAGIIP